VHFTKRLEDELICYSREERQEWIYIYKVLQAKEQDNTFITIKVQISLECSNCDII